jgi:hypothetical protein
LTEPSSPPKAPLLSIDRIVMKNLDIAELALQQTNTRQALEELSRFNTVDTTHPRGSAIARFG